MVLLSEIKLIVYGISFEGHFHCEHVPPANFPLVTPFEETNQSSCVTFTISLFYLFLYGMPKGQLAPRP